MNRILLLITYLFSTSLLIAQVDHSDLRQGNEDFSEGRYDEAEINYRRGLDKNKESIEGYINLGNALYRQSKFEDALEQYNMADSLMDESDVRKQELSKQLANTYTSQGNQYYKNGKFADAVSCYQEGLKRDSSSYESYYNLGNALSRQDSLQSAVNQYDKAIELVKNSGLSKDELNKNLSSIYHNKGNALFGQQLFSEALEAYKQALIHNPKSDASRYNYIKTKDLLKQNKNQQQNDQQKDQQKDQQQDQQQEKTKSGMDREKAEQILQALEQDEKDTQEKRQVPLGVKKQFDKNW
jgi:tetratricopeptide (TPR) repeat protein